MKLGGKVGCVIRMIASILVKVRLRFWIRELFNFHCDSSPLRDRAKNDIVLSGMIFQKCIGPDRFSWIRHYVVEVCALQSALPVQKCIGPNMFSWIRHYVAQVHTLLRPKSHLAWRP